MRGGEGMKRTPEEYKKIAQEVLDVLVRNRMRRNEAYEFLNKVAKSVYFQDCEVDASEITLRDYFTDAQ